MSLSLESMFYRFERQAFCSLAVIVIIGRNHFRGYLASFSRSICLTFDIVKFANLRLEA